MLFALSAPLLPLLAAASDLALSPASFSSRSPLLVPTELAGLASASPCVVLVERDISGAVSFLENVSCHPDLLPFAQSALVHHLVPGEPGTFVPYTFRTEVPWAIDKEQSGLTGRAGSYPADLVWTTSPTPGYQGLPSWTDIPAGQVGSCSMLLHVDAGQVLQSSPLSCPEALQHASEVAVKHWRFEKRGGGRDPMLLPVTLDFQVLPPIEAASSEPPSLKVTVPVSDPENCYFTLWRDEGGQILGRSPRACSVELWERLDVHSLILPAVDEDDGATTLCWNPERGLISDPPGHWSTPVVKRQAETASYPGKALEEAALACRMLVTLDAEQRPTQVDPLRCHPDLQEPAREALLQTTWFRFDRPGFARQEQVQAYVDFEGIEGIDPMRRKDLQVQQKKAVQPRYPERARQLGLEATCLVRMEVDISGHTRRSSIDSDCPSLFVDAIQAVLGSWSFYPTMIDGQPVPATFALKLQFVRD